MYRCNNNNCCCCWVPPAGMAGDGDPSAVIQDPRKFLENAIASCQANPCKVSNIRALRSQAESLIRHKRDEADRGLGVSDIRTAMTAREQAQERLASAIASYSSNPTSPAELDALIRASYELERVAREDADLYAVPAYPYYARVYEKVQEIYHIPRWRLALDGVSLIVLVGAVLAAILTLSNHVPQSAVNMVVLLFAVLELVGEFGRQAVEKKKKEDEK